MEPAQPRLDDPSDMAAGGAPGSWRVDPYAITDFDRTPAQREALFCFCAAVAGKRATMISGKAHDFLAGCGHGGSPFGRIRAMVAEGSLLENLRRVRLGKYRLLGACYATAAADPDLDLATASPDRLERFPGFGMKTSRFMAVHSQRGVVAAVIDTHILKYLRDIGAERVPDTIPTGREYLRLEAAILAEAARLGLPPFEFDLRTWTWYSRGNTGLPDFARAA